MTRIFTMVGTLAVVAAVVVVGGCKKPDGSTPRSEQKLKGDAKTDKSAEHTHGEGPHGGAVCDWGGGKYHVEFKPDHDKKEVTAWILGGDEKTATPIKTKTISVSIKGLKTNDNFEMVLTASPEKGDPAGTTSRFVGTHEKIGIEQEFEGDITGKIDGTPYTGHFKEKPEEPKKDAPKK